MSGFEKAVQQWLGGRVCFGGEWMTRAAVYGWFRSNGYPERAAELWLAGYERTR